MSSSGHFSQRQAKLEVLKIYSPNFISWAWSKPRGYVLSVESFGRIPVLGWKIRYVNFQPTLDSSFKIVFHNFFFQLFYISLDIIMTGFLSNLFPFECNKTIIIIIFEKIILFSIIRNVISNQKKIENTVFPRLVSAETILFWIWPYELWPLTFTS